MNYMPKIDRRSFLVGTAAVAADSASASPSVRRRRRTRPGGTPESRMVVIRPDDTVVIRIRSSEMGQGSPNRLRSLWPRARLRLWSKVTTEIPTPARTSRANASGAISILRQRAYANRTNTYAKGGAARAKCSYGRGQRMESAGFRAGGRQGCDHTTKPEPSTTYGKVAGAAAKLDRRRT